MDLLQMHRMFTCDHPWQMMPVVPCLPPLRKCALSVQHCSTDEAYFLWGNAVIRKMNASCRLQQDALVFSAKDCRRPVDGFAILLHLLN